ncbi:MAG: DegT/DnrJ/EryC1/StrS family aminotransferase [Candidatus Thorarchaeota archaeon]|nr:DegT/DnrJ/EryC1/StrS family aminotransferase [Candidatus Thorarchaeota archaeon]
MNDEKRRVLVSDLKYDQDEVDAVVEVLKSEWLTMGPKTIEFEKALTEYLGAGDTIAVNNGTSALHLALLGLGVEREQEVIVTPISFVASANVVLYLGAKPVFADVNPRSFNIDPDNIQKVITEKTAAVLPVHIAGLPAEMDQILGIAKERGLKVLDDAAHAIGAKYRGKNIGTISDISAFSFFSNKNLSVGEGGAVSTGDKSIAERIRLMRSHGLTKSTWSRHHDKDQESYDQLYDMVELGYNYRITEMSAALGIVQLSKLDGFNKRRQAAYNLYKDLLETLPLEMQDIPDHATHSHHVLPVLVPEGMRSKVRLHLEKHGVGTSIHYTPIHTFTYYQRLGYKIGSLPNAEMIGRRVVTLPMHQNLSDDNIHYIVGLLKDALAL